MAIANEALRENISKRKGGKRKQKGESEKALKRKAYMARSGGKTDNPW